MLPNFLIVGAAKSGTTSLYEYLKQHQEIYMSPIKEPYFFSFIDKKPNFKGPFDKKTNEKEIITDLSEYEKLFENVSNEIAIGECSTSYLFFNHSAVNIKKYIPECKIIIILRNPIERAFSHYVQHVKIGHENLSFEEAIKEEPKRKNLNWRWSYQYLSQGLYYKQVKNYFNIFDKKQIKIYLFEEFTKNTYVVLNDIYQFLGVTQNFKADVSKKYNTGGFPKNKFIHWFLRNDNILRAYGKYFFKKRYRRKIINWLIYFNYNNNKPKLKDSTKEYLKEYFKEDVLKLQELIEKDLSNWLL